MRVKDIMKASPLSEFCLSFFACLMLLRKEFFTYNLILRKCTIMIIEWSGDDISDLHYGPVSFFCYAQFMRSFYSAAE